MNLLQMVFIEIKYICYFYHGNYFLDKNCKVGCFGDAHDIGCGVDYPLSLFHEDGMEASLSLHGHRDAVMGNTLFIYLNSLFHTIVQ